MTDKKIAIIGCGNLGQAILKGLLDERTFPFGNLTATKRKTESIKHYEALGVTVTDDNVEAIKTSEIIILALKPYNILTVLKSFAPHLAPKKHVIVSLATGITTAEIEAIIPNGVPAYRAMPNTAADVKESLTCLCSGANGSDHFDTIKQVFDLLGTTVIIGEELMESATVLGACGIAYVMRFMRAMVQGGIQIGFDAETAAKIVNQTVKGASELLIERKQHPEYEIDKVTTPKGCTIVGLNEMEHNGFSSALIKGLIASFDKIEN